MTAVKDKKSKRATRRRRRPTGTKQGKKVTRKTVETYPIPQGLPYDTLSYILFFIGLLLELIGFFVMWKKDEMVISVITIVVGLVILIPIAIYRRGKDKKEAEESQSA